MFKEPPHTQGKRSLFHKSFKQYCCIKLLVFDIYPVLAKIKLCYIHGLNFPTDTQVMGPFLCK